MLPLRLNISRHILKLGQIEYQYGFYRGFHQQSIYSLWFKRISFCAHKPQKCISRDFHLHFKYKPVKSQGKSRSTKQNNLKCYNGQDFPLGSSCNKYGKQTGQLQSTVLHSNDQKLRHLVGDSLLEGERNRDCLLGQDHNL